MEEGERQRLRECLRWVDALVRSMETCLRGEDPTNVWKHGGYRQFARKYNQIAGMVAGMLELPPIVDLYDLDKMPGPGHTVGYQQKELFESVHANASILKAYLESQLGVVEDETMALRDFLQARLRSAVLKPPERERDVQDALEQLLIGRGLLRGQDYDRETGRVRVSTKEMIPDFVLPKLSLALEVKLVQDRQRTKTVVDEIAADTVGYSKMYRRILFVVYDMGFVRDEAEFCHGLEADGKVSVVVVKN